MPVLQTVTERASASFAQHRQQTLALIEGFRELERRVRDTSNPLEPRFLARGQQLPRERLARLLDRGSPWLELSTLAGLRMHDGDGEKNVLGGGIITGIFVISGIGGGAEEVMRDLAASQLGFHS